MEGENKSNLDGMMKDTYSSKTKSKTNLRNDIYDNLKDTGFAKALDKVFTPASKKSFITGGSKESDEKGKR